MNPPSVQVDTSVAAAEAIKPSAETLRNRVLSFIRSREGQGATRDEIEQSLRLSGNTVRPRVWELMERGLVIDSGARRTLPTGRRAAVLITPEWL